MPSGAKLWLGGTWGNLKASGRVNEPPASPVVMQECESSPSSCESGQWEVSKLLTLGKSVSTSKKPFMSQNQPNKQKPKTHVADKIQPVCDLWSLVIREIIERVQEFWEKDHLLKSWKVRVEGGKKKTKKQAGKLRPR